MQRADPNPSTTYILKIAGACNLNCTYCYMYNLGDTSYLSRPSVMSDAIATAALGRIIGYAQRQNLPGVSVVLHGGEPLMTGKRWFAWLLDEAKRLAPEGFRINFTIQTNGTLLDEEWIGLMQKHEVSVGISIDGPEHWHDRFRVNHAGRGSYLQVRRSIKLLVDANPTPPPWGVLTVANPEFSGVEIYRHFMDLGIRQMDFLWPDYHHDMPPPWPQGALADYYIALFDEWFDARDAGIRLRWFEMVIRMILGGKSQVDALGPQPLDEVVIETDGSLEPLDVIRTCGDGMTQLGLNVETHDIEDLRATDLFKLCLTNQQYLSDECLSCPVYQVCGGGYMPHRWGRGHGFGNPSIHSADLRRVITYIQTRVRQELSAVGRADLMSEGGAFEGGGPTPVESALAGPIITVR